VRPVRADSVPTTLHSARRSALLHSLLRVQLLQRLCRVRSAHRHRQQGQRRNFGLKSGGTNSEGERGTVGSRGETGGEWGLWGLRERREFSQRGLGQSHGQKRF